MRRNLARARAGLWALRAAWAAHRGFAREGLTGGVRLPPPPDLPMDVTGTVRKALRLTRTKCLARAAVLQTWHAAHGRPRDMVIGVTASAAGAFEAHAWLDGAPGWEGAPNARFTELVRRPPPGSDREPEARGEVPDVDALAQTP